MNLYNNGYSVSIIKDCYDNLHNTQRTPNLILTTIGKEYKLVMKMAKAMIADLNKISDFKPCD